MSVRIFASACGFALATSAASLNAQDSSTTDPSGSAEPSSTSTTETQPVSGSDAAKRKAEQAGMQNVQSVEGATVLEGSTSTIAKVFMIVGPEGDLLAVATPLPVPATNQTGSGSGSTKDKDTSAQMPEAGEPAQSGYMATQTRPATPGMWDPAAVEGAMQQLELGTRGVAGEVPQ